MVDLSRVRDIAKGDKVFVKSLIDTFIEELENGLRDYERFLAEGKIDHVRKIVHNFASSCKLFKVESFYTVLKNIKDLYIRDEKKHKIQIERLLEEAKAKKKDIVSNLISYKNE